MNTRRGELYRNPSRGKIAGVCAGIADYFGWETWLVRILVVSGVLFGMPFLILGYVAAWFILDKNPKGLTKKSHAKFHRAEASNQFHRRNAHTEQDYEYDQANESIKVKARVWQSGEPPKQAFHDIRRKFRSLEKQLQRIEQYVTSSEFTVAREINKL
jgi:phage shock protein C